MGVKLAGTLFSVVTMFHCLGVLGNPAPEELFITFLPLPFGMKSGSKNYE